MRGRGVADISTVDIGCYPCAYDNHESLVLQNIFSLAKTSPCLLVASLSASLFIAIRRCQSLVSYTMSFNSAIAKVLMKGAGREGYSRRMVEKDGRAGWPRKRALIAGFLFQQPVP
jgi:hypothetical protein